MILASFPPAEDPPGGKKGKGGKERRRALDDIIKCKKEEFDVSFVSVWE